MKTEKEGEIIHSIKPQFPKKEIEKTKEHLNTEKDKCERDPLREKTIHSIRQTTILFQGSRKRSVPQKIFHAFLLLYEKYQAEAKVFAQGSGFAVPVECACEIYKKEGFTGYFHTLPHGRYIYYHRRSCKLRICLYHDYKRKQDIFRMSLSLKVKPADTLPVKLETYAVPADEALREFYQQCRLRRARQVDHVERSSYLEPKYNTFVAFDLERTGRTKEESAAQDKIIEIGAVKVVDGRITDTFDQLVNPHKTPMGRVMRMTGITPAMLKGQPGIRQALQDFLAFAGNHVLLGHGIDDNDLPPIRLLARQFGFSFSNHHYDTLHLSEVMKKSCGFERTSLEYLAEQLGIEPEHLHRAMDDAATTAKVYLRLKELYYHPPVLGADGIVQPEGSEAAGQQASQPGCEEPEQYVGSDVGANVEEAVALQQQ